MRPAVSALTFAFLGFIAAAVFFIAASIVLAWTGPTSAPPNGNVSAPINVGTTDQVKNAGLGINSLAVFGNAILAGTSRYLNFGSTAGSGGYGFRDNAGTMEFKNSTGNWSGIVSTSTTFSQIKFADGSTQTSAELLGERTVPAFNTVYQAATDGFIVSSAGSISSQFLTYVYADTSNPPTALRGEAACVTNAGTTLTVAWVPIGQ